MCKFAAIIKNINDNEKKYIQQMGSDYGSIGIYHICRGTGGV